MANTEAFRIANGRLSAAADAWTRRADPMAIDCCIREL